MTTPNDLVRILQDLPARHPRIIALAWELLEDDGGIVFPGRSEFGQLRL